MPDVTTVHPPLAGDRLVFVGGLHRSGTSPLARALASHEDISAMHGTGAPEDEGQHLQSVYAPALASGGAGSFALDPGSHLDEQHAGPDVAARLSSDWSGHWDLDRPVLLEKSPPNLVRMRYLQAVFPGARFILLVRHPLVVSLAQKKGRRPSLDHLVRHWLAAHERAAADAAKVEQLFLVTYEHLTAAPDAVVGRIHQWLGIEPRPVPADVALAPRDEHYHARWDALQANALLGAYTSHLARRYGGAIASFGYRFDRWGPDLDALSRRFPTAQTP